LFVVPALYLLVGARREPALDWKLATKSAEPRWAWQSERVSS
jgi:hypothetical protein